MDEQQQEQMYVVLAPFVGHLTRGDLVTKAELPNDNTEGMIGEGSIREATAQEVEAGVNVEVIPPVPMVVLEVLEDAPTDSVQEVPKAGSKPVRFQTAGSPSDQQQEPDIDGAVTNEVPTEEGVTNG